LKSRFLFVFQEKKSIRPTFSAERIFGGTVLAMCSNDFICFYDWAECRLIRRIDVNVKVSAFWFNYKNGTLYPIFKISYIKLKVKILPLVLNIRKCLLFRYIENLMYLAHNLDQNIKLSMYQKSKKILIFRTGGSNKSGFHCLC
jgi:hypothetical protein